MNYAALGWFAGYEVVSRFHEARNRPQSECHSKPGIQSEVILRLGSGDIEFRVIQPATSHDVGLRTRSRKCINEIGQYSTDSKIIGWPRGTGLLARKCVVDPVKPNSDRQFGNAKCEGNDSVEAGLLGLIQLPDWDSRASTDSQSESLLTRSLIGNSDSGQSRGQHDLREKLHLCRQNPGELGEEWAQYNEGERLCPGTNKVYLIILSVEDN